MWLYVCIYYYKFILIWNNVAKMCVTLDQIIKIFKKINCFVANGSLVTNLSQAIIYFIFFFTFFMLLFHVFTSMFSLQCNNVRKKKYTLLKYRQVDRKLNDPFGLTHVRNRQLVLLSTQQVENYLYHN